MENHRGDFQETGDFSMEQMLSVAQTAQVLGLCVDSVRRHLRSGKLPGVRIGRSWRVSETVLSAHLGMTTVGFARSLVESEKNSAQTNADATGVEQEQLRNRALIPASDGLQVGFTHERLTIVVQRAAHHADLSQRATQRLLAELDDLLQTGDENGGTVT